MKARQKKILVHGRWLKLFSFDGISWATTLAELHEFQRRKRMGAAGQSPDWKSRQQEEVVDE